MDLYEEPVRRMLESAAQARTCPNCGDVMPVGWSLDDHFNCNWPEEFAALGEDH